MLKIKSIILSIENVFDENLFQVHEDQFRSYLFLKDSWDYFLKVAFEPITIHQYFLEFIQLSYCHIHLFQIV